MAKYISEFYVEWGWFRECFGRSRPSLGSETMVDGRFARMVLGFGFKRGWRVT